jgi:hypothetical protein
MSFNTESIKRAVKNIDSEFKRREKLAVAKCRQYAGSAEKDIKKKQGTTKGQGTVWTNRTSQAIEGIQGYVIKDKDEIGWGVCHTMEYGVYLETANDRKYEILWPMVQTLKPRFEQDIKAIYEKG